MSVLIEFIPYLFVALAFDFILYITGAGVLRIISFGLFQYKLHSFSKYKQLKGKPNNSYLMPYVVGILFYALIIFSIAWLN